MELAQVDATVVSFGLIEGSLAGFLGCLVPEELGSNHVGSKGGSKGENNADRHHCRQVCVPQEQGSNSNQGVSLNPGQPGWDGLAGEIPLYRSLQ
ncbi:hypothetical protein [Paeniglutamicibacter kerguelensis]|uniref:Uncharacterized protein n=1 Tax=Paeniglutamicibacter kerguelensis TaxID=254788 RepID=A0ABS4XC04_9MICC|nr:hypothetical protein [Paeniglutamicibacter kerguelensis]MBP2386000.1 hypothetical protein [Paeniglutamicibacter kerguelensis]